MASCDDDSNEQTARESLAPTLATDGTTRVVLINDGRRRQLLTIKARAGAAAAMLERLQAPSIASEQSITLGGQSFGSQTTTGLLAGAPRLEAVEPADGSYLVCVPAASAALVTIR